MTTGSRWMVRVLVAIVVLLAISPILCLCPCTQIETKRFVEFDETRNTLLFVASGFRACPITVEGPFPHWGHAVKVVLRANAIHKSNRNEVYQLGKDFSTQYDVASSGTVTLDSTNRTASIKLDFIESYSWLKVQGDFQVIPPHTPYQTP